MITVGSKWFAKDTRAPITVITVLEGYVSYTWPNNRGIGSLSMEDFRHEFEPEEVKVFHLKDFEAA